MAINTAYLRVPASRRGCWGTCHGKDLDACHACERENADAAALCYTVTGLAKGRRFTLEGHYPIRVERRQGVRVFIVESPPGEPAPPWTDNPRQALIFAAQFDAVTAPAAPTLTQYTLFRGIDQ